LNDIPDYVRFKIAHKTSRYETKKQV